MSYRKIEVNGKTYEYVLGKQAIKIKGVGVFPKESYGELWTDVVCDCGCDYTGSDFGVEDTFTRVIRPAHIRHMILKHA